jgi:amino acid transporter
MRRSRQCRGPARPAAGCTESNGGARLTAAAACTPARVASLLLQYGGPVAIIWGWILVTTMNLFVGLALSEMASAFPTAGGVFYWSGRMGGKRWG